MKGGARRISYQALGKGVPVRVSGGEVIGAVEHVRSSSTCSPPWLSSNAT